MKPSLERRDRIVALALLGPNSIEQAQFHDPKGIYNFFAAGSKSGKTFNMTEYCARILWSKPRRQILWAAPYKYQTDQSFDLLRTILPKKYTRVGKQERVIELANGSKIKYMPLDRDPEAIESGGNHLVVLDEASKMKFDVYRSAKTTITKTRGRIVAISTPRGQANWFYREYMRGIGGEVNYYSINFPTMINREVSVEMLLDQRASMDYDSYQQYILARFLEGQGSKVFRKLDRAKVKVSGSGWREIRPNRSYIMGVDLARLGDYSVAVIGEVGLPGEPIRIVELVRYPHADWKFQKRMIFELHRKWNRCPVIIDATGPGQPIAEDLGEMGIPTQEFLLNNQRKVMLIQRLQISFEEELLRIPETIETQVLFFELDQYEYMITPIAKQLGYTAPRGVNDDTVIALALMNFHMTNLRGGTTLEDIGLTKELRSNKRRREGRDPFYQYANRGNIMKEDF